MADPYEVILLAAGSARRFHHPEKLNKVLMPLADRPVFDYSFRLFNKDTDCRKIWFVVNAVNQPLIQDYLIDLYKEMPEKIQWVIGGRERQDSVARALAQMTCTDQGKIMIHDAARPFVTRDLLDALIQAGKASPAVTLGIPAKDSMKIVRDKRVVRSLFRPEVWHIQTPQLFDSIVLKQAVDQAEQEHFYGNEETELVERAGYPVKVISGSDDNFKLTTAFDYQMARMLKES